MNASRGFLTVGRLGGAPLRLHWTLPLGAFFMGRFQFVPAFWLGFVLLILIHEVGHALIVLRYRLSLMEIVVHGVGGYCSHAPARTEFQEAVIAWGGVLAQFAALAVALLVLAIAGPPTSLPAAQFAHVFVETNLWLIAINLLPIGPLDGRKAWPLLAMLWRRRRQAASASPRRAPRSVTDELRDLEKLQTGPGVIGDAETPSQRTERIVRELIARTTQSKSGR